MTLQNIKSVSRDSNIELLRIVLMLMIIAYHLIVHGAEVGGSLNNYELIGDTSVAYLLLKSFLVIAVNCFVFISGFYRIKFKVKTVLNLLLQVLFYSLLFTLLADVFLSRLVSAGAYVKAFFSLFSGKWWFITAYLALYLLSPLLNAAVDTFSRQKFLFVVISLTIINMVSGFLFSVSSVGANHGFSVISFVHIYLLAQYIKKYVDLDKIKKYSLVVYLGSSLLIFLLALFSISYASETGIIKTFAYNNPLVLISAVSFFFCFKQLKLQSKLINNVSAYVLGIYLFHDHPLMRAYLIDGLYSVSKHASAYMHFLGLLAATLLVFLAGLVVDKLRAFLLTPITKLMIRKFKLLRIDQMLYYQNQK